MGWRAELGFREMRVRGRRSRGREEVDCDYARQRDASVRTREMSRGEKWDDLINSHVTFMLYFFPFLISPTLTAQHILSASMASLSTSLFSSLPKPTPSPPPPPSSLTFHPSKPSLTTLTKTLTTTVKCTSDLSPPQLSHTPQTLKSRLSNNETLYGLFLLSFSPTLAEIAALAGYDFVVLDMEHGPGGIPEALTCLRALGAAATPAVLRLPESTAAWAKKALDLGPQGIMFPMIESPKEARKAVSYCRFPPGGVRGSAHTVVRASRYGIDDGYLTNYEDDLLIMCQVESEEGVKKVDEIVAVDGVDCIQMGPLDLSASLGYLWDPGHKKVREVLRGAEKAVLASAGKKNGGAYLAGFAMPHDGPEQLKLRGYNMVSGAVDVGLFRNAALEDVKKFKMGLPNGSEDDEEEDKPKDEKYWSE